MKKIIITKQNGKSKKILIEENQKTKQKTSIIESLELDEHCKFKNDIFNVNRYLKAGIKRMEIKEEDNDFYARLYSLFKSKNRKNDVLNFLHVLKKDFDNSKSYLITKSNLRSYDNLINNNPEILIKLTFKIIIEKYYEQVISNLSDEELYSIYLKVLSQEDISEMINIDDEYKELVKSILIKKIISVYKNRFKHLCWENCENLLNCDKIEDNLKSFIYDYNFIKDGYQIISIKTKRDNKKYLKTDCMYITKCDNYVKRKIKNN